MDFISDINVIYVLAFANALILLAVAAILRGEPRPGESTGRSAGHQPAQQDGEGNEALNRLLLERLDEIGQRLGQLERLSADARQAPAPVAAGGGSQRYGEALRLVGGGAAPDDLVSRCGLSRGEADLFVRLHGNRHRGEAHAVRRVP